MVRALDYHSGSPRFKSTLWFHDQLPRLIKWILGTPGNLVTPRSGSLAFMSWMLSIEKGHNFFLKVLLSSGFPFIGHPRLFSCCSRGFRYHIRCVHVRICLILVLRLVLMTFVSGFRLDLIYIPPIESISLSLSHHQDFYLLVLL